MSCFRFPNKYNKLEIALRFVQFLFEIKLGFTNRTPARRSCDFVITRLISDQIALHEVKLPLCSAALQLPLPDTHFKKQLNTTNNLASSKPRTRQFHSLGYLCRQTCEEVGADSYSNSPKIKK